MVEIEKNGCKICICGFSDKSQTIDLLQVFRKMFDESSLELNLPQFAENIFENNLKYDDIKNKFIGLNNDDIYIGCFYLFIDGKMECNGVCVKNKNVVVFGESFTKKSVKISTSKEDIDVLVGTNFDGFVGKMTDTTIFICDLIKDDGEKNVYKFDDKTRVYVYKNEDSKKIVL